MTAIKHWPFVESPGDFTDRLADAIDGSINLLAAVRTVLIEHPPEISSEMLRRLGADWQPIETAPHEEWVMVFDKSFLGVPCVCEAMQYHREGWMTFGANGGMHIKPTLWMRKPATPETTN